MTTDGNHTERHLYVFLDDGLQPWIDLLSTRDECLQLAIIESGLDRQARSFDRVLVHALDTYDRPSWSRVLADSISQWRPSVGTTPQCPTCPGSPGSVQTFPT